MNNSYAALGPAILLVCSNLSQVHSQTITSLDVWDVSQGAVVTGASGWSQQATLNTIPNIFGASVPVISLMGYRFPGEEGNGFFGEFQAQGFVHWVEWTTPTPVTVVGYHLFANSDMTPTLPGARAFSTFRLLIRNPSSLQYEVVDSFSPPTIDYNSVFTGSFSPVVADHFRAEFVQSAPSYWGSAQAPRITELDAVAVPELDATCWAGIGTMVVFAATRLLQRR